MQRPGTEAIRTQIKPSKLKRKITEITNSQNTKRTYGQPSEQLFPKRWPPSNPNRTKNNMNTRKVKCHLNSNTKTGNIEPKTNTFSIRFFSDLYIAIKHSKCFNNLVVWLREVPNPLFNLCIILMQYGSLRSSE